MKPTDRQLAIALIISTLVGLVILMWHIIQLTK